MQKQFLGLLVIYAIAAWATRRIPVLAWRKIVFALLNVAFTMAIFSLGKWILLFYLGLISFEFILTRFVSGRLAVSMGIFVPVICLFSFRHLSGDFLGYNANGAPLSTYLVGFSYVAFRMSYAVMEVKNGLVKPFTWSDYVAFLLFPPALLVGPITRFSVFQNSWATEKRKTDWSFALQRILIGAVKYLFAANLLNRLTYAGLMMSGGKHGLSDFLVAMFASYLFLYCNFSGFCDIVVGLGAVIGIEIDENFANPLQARNVQDFWNRWHITLSTYLRDIVFTPLCKTLAALTGPKYVTHVIALCLFCIFLIVGFWHGPTLNYFIFGALQGLGIVTVHYYGLFLKRHLSRDRLLAYQKNRIIKTLAITATFLFAAFSQFFFTNSWPEIQSMYQNVSVTF